MQKAVKSQSNERAVGVCGIPSELYKFGSTNLHRCLLLLFNLMLSTMTAPRDFTTSILVPIFKTGKPRGICSSFRPVSLLCTARKVMTSALLSASRPEFDNFIRPRQTAFKKGHCTTDCVFAVKTITEKALVGDWDCSIALLDMSRAFDTVYRDKLLEVLQESLGSDKANAIMLLFENTQAKVKINRTLSHTFDVGSGVFQGDGLSPKLFTAYLEAALRHIPQVSESGVPFDDLEYADDISFIHRSPRALQDKVQQAKEHLGEWGLQVNDAKTHGQWLEVRRGGPSEWRECIYLGSCIDTEMDIKRRCRQADAALHTIRAVVFRRSHVPTGLKIKLFKTLVISVLLYNSELWTTRKASLDRLDRWHRKRLRQLLAIYYPNVISNEDLYTRTGQEPISQTVQRRRLKWFGHCVRAAPNSPAAQAFTLALDMSDVKRPRGRPPLRWIDIVKKDVATIGLSLTEAANMAANRERWHELVVDICSV